MSDDHLEGYELGEEIPTSYLETTVEQVTTEKRALVCNGCGYKWFPNKDKPKRCAECTAMIKWDAISVGEGDGDEVDSGEDDLSHIIGESDDDD